MNVETLLQQKGILETPQQTRERTERQLSGLVEVLQSRYPEDSVPPESVAWLKAENSDLDLNDLNSWTMRVHNKRAKDYLLSRGLLLELDSGLLSERMPQMSAILQRRYASAGVKPSTIHALQKDSPDLPFKDFWQWTRDYRGKSPVEYLLELGVLDMGPDRLWEYECFRFWTRTSSDNFNYPDALPCEGKQFFITGQYASWEELEQMARRIQSLGGPRGGNGAGGVGCYPGRPPQYTALGPPAGAGRAFALDSQFRHGRTAAEQRRRQGKWLIYPARQGP